MKLEQEIFIKEPSRSIRHEEKMVGVEKVVSDGHGGCCWRELRNLTSARPALDKGREWEGDQELV